MINDTLIMNSVLFELFEKEVELKRANELIGKQKKFIDEKISGGSIHLYEAKRENTRLGNCLEDIHEGYQGVIDGLRSRILRQRNEIKKLLEEKENAYSNFKMKQKKPNRFGTNVEDGYQKSFVKIVKDWIKKGMNYEEVKILAYARNITFDPPLSGKELETIIKKTWRESE